MSTFESKGMIVAALGLVFLAAGPVLAQETSIWTTDFQKAFRTEKMMKMIDKSGDHMVSKEEYMKHMEAMFDMMDKNHDGMLDKKEFMYSKVLGGDR